MRRTVKIMGVPVLLALIVLMFTGTNCQRTDASGNQTDSLTNRGPVENRAERFAGGEQGNGRESVPDQADDDEYAALWKEVENHRSKGLPKSALKVVQRIYNKAKEKKHAGQLIKALIHTVRYFQQVEENAFVKIQARLTGELRDSKFPVAPVLHSMLAEQYWNYYRQNRFRLLRRSATDKEFKQDDLRTWDARRIVETVVEHFHKSLQYTEQSKKTRIDVFNDILNMRVDGRKYRPTLYDFLAHRAVDVFMNSEAGLTRPRYEFTINDSAYLSDSKTFADLKLETKDPLSFKFFALQILQDLVRFHLNDDNPMALIDADLKRLGFVYQYGVISNKDHVYEEALRRMLKLFDKHPAAAEIYFRLASLYDRLGNNYSPRTSEDFKWHKKKARELCAEAIKKYPGSYGAKQCQDLIYRIEGKHLNLTFENVSVRNKPSRTLLQYKNMDRVHIRIFKSSLRELQETDRLDTDKKLARFLGKTPVKEWSIDVPDDKDYQSHSSEIKIDGLDWGVYVVFASFDSRFQYKTNGLTYGFFMVSNISYVKRKRAESGWEFYVLDRDSGHGLLNPKAQVWHRVYDQKQRRYVLKKGELFNGNSLGYVNIPFGAVKDNYFSIEFIHGKDSLYSHESYNLYKPYNRFRRETRCVFFTDRAIYRPGQTVYFKGIMLEVDTKNGEKSKILPDTAATVALYDVNSQQVSKLQLKTNRYGTFSGSFQLPAGLLNGNFRIEAGGYGSKYFSVEEYKRPKFNVSFKPLEKTYRLDETVTVTGEAKAYAGYMIDNADVKYRVVRQVFYPYSWCYIYRWGGYSPPTPSLEVTNGVTKTGADGVFKVDFKAIPDLTVAKRYRPAFRYTVYADVTDLNGETHSSSKTVAIGDTALIISASVPGLVDKDPGKKMITINSTTLSGDFIKAEGTVTIHRLETPKRVLRSRLWSPPDTWVMKREQYYKEFPFDIYDDESMPSTWKKSKQVFSGSFDTGEVKSLVLNNLNRWAPGKYVLEMSAKDRYGNPVKEIKYFTLYSAKDDKTPFPMLDWFTVPKTTLQPGENAVILVGSGDNGVKVLYEIEHRDKIVKSQWLTINNRQARIIFPIQEKHRGNVGVHVTFVRHNRLVMHSSNLYVPWNNKKLDVSFRTFRNKLLPGEKEEWQLLIKGPKGDRAAAEMVATLYDASLDAFRSNSWGFNVFPSHYLYHQWTGNNYFGTAGTDNYGNFRKHASVGHRYYDSLNWFGFYLNDRLFFKSQRRTRASMPTSANMPPPAPRVAMKAKAEFAAEAEEEKVALSDDMSGREMAKKADGGKDKRKNGDSAPGAQQDKKKAEPVKARTNFNETAFFYPHLKTNEKGEIIVSFTVPEALTKWKMMGFAHNTQLQHGFVSNELVTQKDLMVVPNTPRFFREGDTLVYTVKVTNLSDKTLSGTARLELFDSVTMKPVDLKFKTKGSEQPFTAKKGQSALVKWKLFIPEDLDAVTYRVTARAGNFSDGEEMAVPILKNRMLVTESMPLPVRANQTKSFTFKKLVNASGSKTLRHRRLTLEFTSNPVWYAVQALPYLMQYPHECMEQVFSRYYANSMAKYIVHKNPKIERVFDIWKAGFGKKDSPNANALLSNLQKNQELKSVLLQETPWVLQGQNESQRKQRIALLFNLNHMARNLQNALNKLKQGQLASGGWPWFKGMRENRYITQHIVTGFAHLGTLKVIETRNNNTVWSMIKRAVLYLDSQINEDYQRLIKQKADLEKLHLGYIQIHYLYARSYFKDIPLDKRDIVAFEYYKGQVKKYWSHFHENKYLQGMMALIMKRYDDSETATDIMASIKEHALYSEEMGMYWKTSYGYYWYQAPIETHALLIEAFDEVLNDAESVDGLKTWLLKQKQTQDWKTTKATANACYALLLKGDDWLEESKEPDITLGKKTPITVQPGTTGGDNERIRAEAGTGYFKTAWTGSAVTEDMGHVTVKNNNNVAAWGSLYWQYFENLDKITPAKTPLSLKKKLFIQKPSDTGPVLVPIEPGKKIKIGDRIKVRIELRVDRSMEYVHMKDMRASAFEPENVISRYKWQDGLGYYESTKDASTNFFIDYLPKGTYVFEYPLRVTHDGNFSNGITSIQCMYAPEFTSHSEGIRVDISSQ